jgi:hypothetical protein
MPDGLGTHHAGRAAAKAGRAAAVTLSAIHDRGELIEHTEEPHMYVDRHAKTWPPTGGPAVYLGYCTRTGSFRMMDLADYLASLQQGVASLTSGVMSMYGDLGRRRSPSRHEEDGIRVRASRCSGDCDGRCTCCACDADVLVYARCAETRRIPVILENDTQREREVRLELAKFMTAGGRDLGWKSDISPATFTLRPCGEQTVVLRVEVSCEPFAASPNRPDAAREPGRVETVDRCEVAYATLRAEGCLVRPIVIAVAILPDDCDAYRGSCRCGCC